MAKILRESNVKKFIIGIIIVFLLTLSACQINSEDSELTPNTENLVFVKSDMARETSSTVTKDQIMRLAQDNSDFAFAFLNQLKQISPGNENFVFSPLSLSLALSMTLAGAEAETEQGMLEALQLTLPEEEIYPIFNALLLQIENSQKMTKKGSEGSQFQLNIANSIWGQSGYDFETDFLDILARYYGAGLYNVNFRLDPEAATEAINEWVANETQEKIEGLIPEGAISELTRLVLANAIYFNGSWLYSFDQANTSEQPFTLLDGSTIAVDMMKLAGKSLAYYKSENFQVVSLPYLSSDFNMMLFVPDQDSFDDFEDQFSSKRLTASVNEMAFVTVDLSMPKFDFESMVSANDALKALGMEQAFDVDKADFSGMTTADELMITDVLHKTTITVDEEGTEATAATAVIVGIRSMPPEPISVVVDRPFYFMITHKPTNTILFLGKVVQP